MASGGLEVGWGFSSLVSSEGLLPFLGHATFIPSSRPCNLFFPLSGKFSWIFLCLPPLDHLGLSSKFTSSERAPLTTLAKVTFLYSFHCFMTCLSPPYIQALLRPGTLICGLLVSAMVWLGKQKPLYGFHV